MPPFGTLPALLLPGSAIVFSNDCPAIVKAMARLAKVFLGDRVQICDGTADDVQINAAIAALPASGGKVWLSEGMFTIAATITITSKRVILQGQGGLGFGWSGAFPADGSYYGCTILKVPAALKDDVIRLACANTAAATKAMYGATICDLAIIGQADGTGDGDNAGIMIDNSSGRAPDGVQIYNVLITGIVWGAHAGYGIKVESGGEHRLHNLVISSCGRHGIEFCGTDSILHDIIVFYTLGYAGLFMSSSSGCQVSDIYAYGCNDFGIQLDGGSPNTTNVYTNLHSEANNNYNIAVGYGGGGRHILMGGMVRNSLTGGGILVEKNTDVVIDGFHIYDDDGTPTQEHGIYLLGAKRVLISNCIFEDNGQQANNTWSDIYLGTSGGVHSTHNRVHGCIFRATKANKVKYGIEEADANQDHNVYHDNYFDGGQVTGKVLMLGVNSTARNNKGSTVDGKIIDPGNAGAIPVANNGQVALVTGGAATRTLAIPTFSGQEITLSFKTDGGDCVVTVASDLLYSADPGHNIITFANVGEFIKLEAVENGAALQWGVIALTGAVLSG